MSDWPGVEDREAREALLADLASRVRYWSEALLELLVSDSAIPDWFDEDLRDAVLALRRRGTPTDADALAAVVGWCMSGLAHSFLVTLDGGSARCPTLDLTTAEGRSLGVALHEEWPAVDPTGA